MSTTDRFSTDPRRHSIYQRGGGPGTDAGAGTGIDTTIDTAIDTAIDTGWDDRESRAEPSRAPGAFGRGTTSSGPAPSHSSDDPDGRIAPVHTGPEDVSTIRELDAEEPEPGVHAIRNPFDRWIWGMAAVLLALGVYLTFTPILFAESIQEQLEVQSSYYRGHWSSYAGTLAIPLTLVGAATTVAQLFVLSHRHARRTR